MLYKVIQFSDPRHPTPLNVIENHTDNSVNINVENSDEGSSGGVIVGTPRVRIEIYVPKRSNLKIDADGEIRVEGVSGDLQLSGSDESINVRDSDGTLRVSTADGRVRVIGFRGQIEAQTSDGSISLEGDLKGLTAQADDGDITVTLPDGAGADIDSNCEDVIGEGIDVKRVSTEQHRIHYKVGSGGTPLRIDSQGEIRIRNANSLRSNS